MLVTLLEVPDGVGSHPLAISQGLVSRSDVRPSKDLFVCRLDDLVIITQGGPALDITCTAWDCDPRGPLTISRFGWSEGTASAHELIRH